MMKITTDQYPINDIIETINTADKFKCTMLPRYFYEVFTRDECETLKSVISNTIWLPSDEGDSTKLGNYEAHTHIQKMLYEWCSLLRDPRSGIMALGGYYTECNNDIDNAFYLRKEIIEPGFYICIRTKIYVTSIDINTNNYINISFKLDIKEVK